MGRESAVDQLSDNDRKWLDDALFANGFNGYVDLAEKLQAKGYQISKSSVHRYGQKLESKLAAVKASTQAAIMIADAAPDDADARSQAVLSMVQTELFNAFVDIQNIPNDEDGEPIDPLVRINMLAKAGKGIAEIVKASVNQKKWQIEVREKAQAVAAKVEKMAQKGGMTAKTIEEIKRSILGIAE